MGHNQRATVCLALLACAAPGISQHANPDRHYVTAKKEWATCAGMVAAKTKNPHAQTVNREILSFMVAAKPVNSNFQFLESPASQRWFKFVAITKKDFSDYPGLNKDIKSDFLASYFPKIQTLVVQDSIPCSDVWRGILLLHEADHAYTLLTKHHYSEDPKTIDNDERDTYDFEFTLTSTFGGARYEDLLEQEIKRLDAVRQKLGKKAGAGYAKQAEYNPALDTILTPAKSVEEKLSRRNSFWMHAVFRQLERDFGKGSAETKRRQTEFISFIYRRLAAVPR